MAPKDEGNGEELRLSESLHAFKHSPGSPCTAPGKQGWLSAVPWVGFQDSPHPWSSSPRNIPAYITCLLLPFATFRPRGEDPHPSHRQPTPRNKIDTKSDW